MDDGIMTRAEVEAVMQDFWMCSRCAWTGEKSADKEMPSCPRCNYAVMLVSPFEKTKRLARTALAKWDEAAAIKIILQVFVDQVDGDVRASQWFDARLIARAKATLSPQLVPASPADVLRPKDEKETP